MKTKNIKIKESTDLEALYQELEQSNYNFIIKELEKIFNTEDDVSKDVKLRDYRNRLIASKDRFTKKDVGDTGFQTDPFTTKLILDFNFRESYYDNHPIKGFLKKSLPLLRTYFINQQDKIIFPEIYSAKDMEILIFLAEYYSLVKFIKDADGLYPRKEDTIEFVINQITKGKKNSTLYDTNDFGNIVDQVEEPNEERLASPLKNEFTVARQVLAMHYMFKALGAAGSDKTEQARFIQFMTCRELNAKTIQNTNIYDRVRAPFSISDKQLLKDLQFVRKYFESVNLTTIVKEINIEIEKHQ